MKAIIWNAYGAPEVLQLGEVPRPSPGERDVLVKVYATTVTAGDCEMRSLRMPLLYGLPMRFWLGFSRPSRVTTPGSEFAGVVEAVGAAVMGFQPGDEVYGSTGLRFGANAEYLCLPENAEKVEGSLAIKPANMSFEEAATVPFGGRDALHFLRKARLQPGQKVLINGAGGSIGVFAVQLAKHFGAEVTAVDSTAKLDMLLTLGADQVVDYTHQDFTKNGEIYDVIFDVVGKLSLTRSERSLKIHGTYLLANPNPSQLIRGQWARLAGGRHVVAQTSSGTAADLVFLRELIEAGALRTFIDRRYPLAQVPEAHRYVETGRKKGNVVINVIQDAASKS